jgi:hypothetical protein
MRNQQAYQSDDWFPSQPADVSFTGLLRGTPVAQVLLTPVQYNPVQRKLRVVRRMVVTLHFDRADAGVFVSTSGETESAIARFFDTVKNESLINPDSPSVSMRIDSESVKAPDVSKVMSLFPDELQNSPFAIRITTSDQGMYRVGYEDIDALGVDVSGLTNSNLKIANQGQEVAVYRSGAGSFSAGDYVLFYAEDFQSEYSSTNVYWLYQGSSDGLVMQTAASAPVSGFPQPLTFTTSLRIERDLVWRRNLPDYEEEEDQWFWRLLNIFGVKTQAMPFTLNNFADDAGLFDIELYMRGLSAFNHRTQMSLNGTILGDFEWQGTDIERFVFQGISPALFNNGANTLTVEALSANDPPLPDSYYVNWAELTCAQRYIADNNRLAFFSDNTGGTTFKVGGFSADDIMVFDVSQPAAPVQISDLDITTSAGISQARFERTVDENSAFFALTPDSSFAPVALDVDSPSDLQQPRSDIDYIIITHPQFAASVEQLKTIRESGGLGVEIVDIQDIYDEFSYGIKDAEAIRDFLRYAYNNWHATDHPTYVVLVGDATYDYQDKLGRAAEGKADLIPTYLGYRGSLGTSVGAVASDNWFVCVDGVDPLPDMVIGRLPVKNVGDLQNILDKIQAYEALTEEDWLSRVLFAVDSDDLSQFENLAEALGEEVPSAYTKKMLYLRDYDTDIATATDDLVDEISNGALIATYIGHGSTDRWSKRTWFETPNQNTGSTRDDVSRLTNVDRYPFLVVLNCLSGTFSEVGDDYAMAEEFVRQPERGAVVCVAPSASAPAEDHEVLGTALFENLFSNNIAVAGALVTISKISAFQLTSSRDLLETYNFFGDPALELNIIAAAQPPDPPDPEQPQLVAPADGAQVPLSPEALFSWNPGPYSVFKIQFSSSEFFEPKKSYFFAPRKKKDFIIQDSYIPDSKEWRRIQRKLFEDSGSVFWRVIAYDPVTREELDHSDYRSFTLKVFPPDPELIHLIEPLDDAQLPRIPEPLFSWDPGPYTHFKIQFSRSALFDPKKFYFLAPRKKKDFITQDSYIPDSKEWRRVQKRLFDRSGIVYWRVIAYDPVTFEELDYSDYNNFVF